VGKKSNGSEPRRGERAATTHVVNPRNIARAAKRFVVVHARSFGPEGPQDEALWGITGKPGIIFKEKKHAFMANTKSLSKEERKKAKRARRKEREQKNPKKKRDYARGSKKRKVKKMARGQAKR
jgi:hypothetical protein